LTEKFEDYLKVSENIGFTVEKFIRNMIKYNLDTCIRIDNKNMFTNIDYHLVLNINSYYTSDASYFDLKQTEIKNLFDDCILQENNLFLLKQYLLFIQGFHHYSYMTIKNDQSLDLIQKYFDDNIKLFNLPFDFSHTFDLDNYQSFIANNNNLSDYVEIYKKFFNKQFIFNSECQPVLFALTDPIVIIDKIKQIMIKDVKYARNLLLKK
jgi:hypothetical protein